MRKQFLAVFGLLALLFMPFVLAVNFDQDISDSDQATFDQILEPVMKIYTLVKYISTAIAALVLLFAGVSYVMSGTDPGKRENSKNMIMYVLIGLVIIWAAPLIVNFVVG